MLPEHLYVTWSVNLDELLIVQTFYIEQKSSKDCPLNKMMNSAALSLAMQIRAQVLTM